MITFTLNFEITLNFMIWLVLQLIGLLSIIKFKVQISKFKVMTMFKTIDFRALTAILLFLLALLFSLPNLVIAIVLMMIISAILEMLRKLADWQPKKQGKLMPRIS